MPPNIRLYIIMSVENIVGSKRPAPDHAVSEEAGGDQIEIKIQFQRQIVTVRRSVNSTIADLKAEIENETGVPAQNQKLLYKQQLNDKQQLHEVHTYLPNICIGTYS